MIEWDAIATAAGGLATAAGAVATLIVGLGAVKAARAVGDKQAGIADRQSKIADRQANIQAEQAEISKTQTAIQARQVRMADVSNRIQLFDRRMRTFNSTKDFLLHFTYEERSEETIARNNEFHERMLESRFLFDQSVHDVLTSVFDKKNELRAIFAIYYSEQPVVKKLGLGDRITDAYQWAQDQLDVLHVVFAPFLDMAPNAVLEEYEAVAATAAPTVY